ncbi:MAG: ABC transporter permease [Anaerolineales bacterium]|jgi:ABC-type lipoprotein release transport system permease subunit
MKGAALLAWRDLSAYRWRVFAHIVVFSITVMAYTALNSYQQSLYDNFRQWPEDQLIVQERNTFAEFSGSRITPEVAEILKNRGVPWAIPEIHAIVGTTMEDAVLLKGVDLDHYRDLENFSIRDGRALIEGDGPRTAILGVRLARRLNASIGEPVRLRGREFEVIGTFETGTYTENEAWIPLSGAQELLGWGEDVSLYIVPEDGSISTGTRIGDDLSVIARGAEWSETTEHWEPLLRLIRTVTYTVGLAAASSLAVMLWRMSWQRRWQFAILRTIGFNRRSYFEYMVIQGVFIGLTGGAVGLFAAGLGIRLVTVTFRGLSLQPHLSANQLALTAGWVVVLTGLSIFLPAVILSHRRVGELVHLQS